MGEKGNFLLNLLAVLIIVALFLPLVFSAIVNSTVTWVVPSSKSHSIAYGASCSATSFFFVESDANFDSDADGNGSMVAPNSSSAGGVSTLCQTGGIAGMTITNTGNVAINLDANVNPDFNGADRNLLLKVWMGRGDGCTMPSGLFAGWASPCTVVGTNPVTQTTCRDFNHGDSNAYARLVNTLGVNGTNQLCFSGDFGLATGTQATVGANVAQGTYVHGFDSNSA